MGCVCGLRLDVVVGDGAALGVLLRELFVGRLGRYGDDVPGVEEAGEEAETCVSVSGLSAVVEGSGGVQQRAMFMRESALQIPRFTQTAMGGKRMAMRPRKTSLPHMVGLSLIVKWLWAFSRGRNKKRRQ